MTTMKRRDYYQILNLTPSCSQEDIAEAYRALSLQYHPKVTSATNSAKFEYHFQKLAEAYEVLSNPILKNIYDIYGHEGLQNGILDKDGQEKGGYRYQGNGHEIFEKFMGTGNPFTLIKDKEKTVMSAEVSSAFNAAFATPEEVRKKEDEIQKLIEKKNEKKTLPPINIDLECTLEELYNGCVKTVCYKKKAISYDLRSTEDKESSVDVEVFKGYDKNTVITFKEMGNDAPGVKSSDLCIHIREKKHNCFKRVNQNDLIYTHQITLAQALNIEPVRLTTLDNRKISVSVDEIISPNTVITVFGEGMPIYEKELSVNNLKVKKGNLYVKFDIKFPEFIDPIKKQEITTLLEGEQ